MKQENEGVSRGNSRKRQAKRAGTRRRQSKAGAIHRGGKSDYLIAARGRCL